MPKEVFDIAESIQYLAQRRILSNESAKILLQNLERNLVALDLSDVEADPFFFYLSFDASNSMLALKEKVLSAQAGILNELRDSSACRKKALFISQYLLKREPFLLQGLTLLAPDEREDQVAVLTETTYQPTGTSGLYKGLFYVLQDLAGAIAHALRCGVGPRCFIVLCTDGDDNGSGHHPEEIRQVLEDLRSSNLLVKATLVKCDCLGSDEEPGTRAKDFGL